MLPCITAVPIALARTGPPVPRLEWLQQLPRPSSVMAKSNHPKEGRWTYSSSGSDGAAWGQDETRS